MRRLAFTLIFAFCCAPALAWQASPEDADCAQVELQQISAFAAVDSSCPGFPRQANVQHAPAHAIEPPFPQRPLDSRILVRTDLVAVHVRMLC